MAVGQSVLSSIFYQEIQARVTKMLHKRTQITIEESPWVVQRR